MYWENYILHRNTRLQDCFKFRGVCRFILHDRNLNSKGYYQGNIDCDNYLEDLNDLEPPIDRTTLIQKY